MENEDYHDEENEEFVGREESAEMRGHSGHHLLVIVVTNIVSGTGLLTISRLIASPAGHGSEIDCQMLDNA